LGTFWAHLIHVNLELSLGAGRGIEPPRAEARRILSMTQANEFMTVLERINSVGMAVQILDSLKEWH